MAAPTPNKARWIAVAIATTLLVVGPMTTADHPQTTDDGNDIRFDHRGGNEWWVQVRVTSDSPVAAVDARDTDGAWLPLEKKSWGDWAASFHVEPGHRVQFRADVAGQMVESCWFTHPDGAEQCPTGGEFTASFDTPGGNDWWVEVYVDANRPLAGVDARADGDAWQSLTLRDWGAWAASFHVPDGSIVEFRAHSQGGDAQASGGYVWPSGEAAGDEAFAASFETPGGNDWWVEVYVDANKPLIDVVARVDGGTWHSLELRDWGAWAESFHVPDGSIVQFRAHATGESDLSGHYIWPSGDQVEEPLDAAFGPKASNEWWVETVVIADTPIVAVEARANDGDWRTLERQDWMAWTGSFHVPDGSVVEFRATAEDGRTDRSPQFVWPSADPVEGFSDRWPHEGSYAHYRHAWGVAGDTHGDVDAIFVHHDDEWRVMCTGTGFGGEEPFFSYEIFGPPRGPVTRTGVDTVEVGDEETVQALDECQLANYVLTVEEVHEHEVRRDGDPVTVETWFGSWVPECSCDYNQADWERHVGIVVHFRDGMTDWAGGDLLDTDAPVG